MSQTRAIKIGLQQRPDAKITTEWKIMEWIVKLSTVLINRCMIGKDGRTPHRRHMGKDSSKHIAELGERVTAQIARAPKSGRKQSLKSRWEDAIRVGIERAHCGTRGRRAGDQVQDYQKEDPEQPMACRKGRGDEGHAEAPEPEGPGGPRVEGTRRSRLRSQGNGLHRRRCRSSERLREELLDYTECLG